MKVEVYYIEKNKVLSKGKMSGHSTFDLVGTASDIGIGDTPIDLWDVGTQYIFSETADIGSVSSSSSADTGTLIVYGLKSDYTNIVQEVSLSGQDTVSIDINLIRVYYAYNNGATDYVGDIYIYVNGADVTSGVPDDTDDIRAKIKVGFNQTQMIVYTVPAGYSALVAGINNSFLKSTTGTAETFWRIRAYGEVFRRVGPSYLISTGTSSNPQCCTLPVFLPEKTDFAIECSAVSVNNTAVTSTISMILINNNYL